ncbi:MAG TPA: helix-turn-helix domain-containing protein [Acetobacteraceae bacterium]|jgi:CRP/FNR family transcriptional activator FtrB
MSAFASDFAVSPRLVAVPRKRPSVALLQRVPMFARLNDATLHRLCAIAEITDAPDGAVLCREGDQADSLQLLIEGQVTLRAGAADGRSAVVEVVRPVRHLVLASVLARLPYAITATAISVCSLVTIGATPLLALLHDDSDLANVLMLAQALDFRAMVREVCDLKLRTAAERLGCYLLELSQDQAGRHSTHLRLPIGKQLLAARIGCRHENLSRAFASLREMGVETHGKRVILHDIPRLRQFAFPDYTTEPKPA